MKVSDDIIRKAILAIKDGDKEEFASVLFEYNFISDINTDGFSVEFKSKNQMTLGEFFELIIKKIGEGEDDK